MVTHTFQAMSDYERKLWVEAMGGKWPSISTLQRIKADSVEDNLNSNAFIFLKDCLAELEARGLRDHGLYRVGGVVSKVKRLLNVGLVEHGAERLDLSDPKQWESKTIASAVKQYFRDLSKPLMTHQLYSAFLEAAKSLEKDESARVQEVALVARRLPRANREMLTVLMRHLNRVASNSHVNLMTAANLGVCFGPTLLRPKEETVATIMDIKFCNEVVEILIEQCELIFPMGGDSSPEVGKNVNISSSANSTASMATGGEDTPDRAVRGGSTPQRTSSVGSFSQLSTNSLPDFKDFRTTVKIPVASHSPAMADSSRIRSRSYQQEQAKPEVPLPRKQVSLPSRNPQKVEIHLHKLEESHYHHQQSSLRSMKSSQDDLMASLEMMNLLAADLPSKVCYSSRSSPLKRSNTLQPNSGSPKSSRKPPLPKLSSANNTPINSSHPYSNLFSNRSNTSPSPSVSSNSNSNSCDSGNSAAASPRMSNSTRAPQSEFLSRMQEKLNNRSRSNSLDNNNLSSNTTPPALPVRKYRQVIVSPNTVVRSENKKVLSNGELHLEDNSNSHSKREENSPPTDSGVAESPIINKSEKIITDELDDCSTISSSVVSVDSVGKTKTMIDNEGINRLSKYDNVTSNNTRGEDGDDEASEDGSSVIRQVDEDDDVTISRLSSQERNFEECASPEIASSSINKISSFPVVEEEEEDVAALSPKSQLKIGARNNRASGMYENVGEDENEKFDEARKEFGENEKSKRGPHPSLSITQEGDELGRQKEVEEGEDGFIESLEGAEGISSIRRMLAVGQTSDV